MIILTRIAVGSLFLLAISMVFSPPRWVPGASCVEAAAPPQARAPAVGDEAPDFELVDQEGEKVRLSSFRGRKKVVLAFYVLAFTGG